MCNKKELIQDKASIYIHSFYINIYIYVKAKYNQKRAPLQSFLRMYFDDVNENFV